MIDDTDFSSADSENFVALVQCRHPSNDDQNEFAGHGSGIIDVPTGLLKKDHTELDDIQYPESNAAHDFEMLKQSLENQWTQDSQASETARSENTKFAEALAAEKADLAEVEKRLASLKASQAVSKSICS